MRSIVSSVDTIDSKNDIDHDIVGVLIANNSLVSARTSRGRGTTGNMGIRTGTWWLFSRRSGVEIRIGIRR